MRTGELSKFMLPVVKISNLLSKFSRVHEAPGADKVTRIIAQVPASPWPHRETASEVERVPRSQELREEDVGCHQDPVACPQNGGAEEVQETQSKLTKI